MNKPSHRKMTNQSPMYIYATEMVSSYYGLLNIKEKRVLSIVGSGDQIIDAYFYGAKEVFGFDINKYSFFMLELKVSAVINLTRKEFIEFFGSNMINGEFNFDLYNRLKDKLSVGAKIFFNKLYREFNYDGRKLIKSHYFRQRSMIKSLAWDINVYLRNEKNYLKCRKIMQSQELKFLELDINDILVNKNLKGKFDIINLSNVLNYLTGTTTEKEVLTVLTNITNNISTRIKTGGLFFYYSYSPSLYNFAENKTPPASRLKIIKQVADKNGFKLTIKRFKGVSLNTLDSLNIFKV